MLRISSAAASHPGLRREDNEDAYWLRGAAGFAFREGSNGTTKADLFGRPGQTPRKKYMDIPT